MRSPLSYIASAEILIPQAFATVSRLLSPRSLTSFSATISFLLNVSPPY
nr:MAG TPA: hypothetical protein [Caudoviricetes sp.]